MNIGLKFLLKNDIKKERSSNGENEDLLTNQL